MCSSNSRLCCAKRHCNISSCSLLTVHLSASECPCSWPCPRFFWRRILQNFQQWWQKCLLCHSDVTQKSIVVVNGWCRLTVVWQVSRCAACFMGIDRCWVQICTYTVSQKKLSRFVLSELCQISTNFDNFWQKDGKRSKYMWGALIFHLT